MRFVIYQDRGMLAGGYVLDHVNLTGLTDEQIKAALYMQLNPPDVRLLDMEAIRAELHQVLVKSQMDVTKISYDGGHLLSICGGVLLRHIEQLTRSGL